MRTTLTTLTNVWASHLLAETKRNYALKGPSPHMCLGQYHQVRCPPPIHRRLIRQTGLSRKKAHLIEIQANGGSIHDAVEFVRDLFKAGCSSRTNGYPHHTKLDEKI
ncbi:hypothetical protein B0H16DRAFT_1740768 [Mycena metata]|uniref:Uncharacterized protein n=1 Tax=Mycena metata TaxID=1033252 RepID=A0AAD7HCH4_9AGAR|nr:hypothetical protein B0H16DRAFT_1740768 [Mycena metata]